MDSTNTLGRYQIIREIARSNDVVYEAIDPVVGRRVALKELVFPPNLNDDERRERIQRFYREAKAAGKLTHPNIVTVFEVGEENGRHYIAMEYLEGQTLRDILRARGSLPVQEAVRIISDLCNALSYAHNNGVIHRDVKPDNVYILPDGRVKLADFGIARITTEPGLTAAGQVFGTPSYMAPEQVTGKPVDGKADIFSLGAMFYEMLVGMKPFTGDTIVTITYNIVHTEPAYPPTIPANIIAVLQRAMAKRPEDRFAGTEEMARALQISNTPAAVPEKTIIPGASSAIMPPAAPQTATTGVAQSPRKPQPGIWIGILAVIVLALATTFVWTIHQTINKLKPPIPGAPTSNPTVASPFGTPPVVIPPSVNQHSSQSNQPGTSQPKTTSPQEAFNLAKVYDQRARASLAANQAARAARDPADVGISTDVETALQHWKDAARAGANTALASQALENYGSLCNDTARYYLAQWLALRSRLNSSSSFIDRVNVQRYLKVAWEMWTRAQSEAPETKASETAQQYIDQYRDTVNAAP